MTDGNLKEDELLKILEAHGEKFLNSFSFPEHTFTSKKRKRNSEIISAFVVHENNSIDEDDEEEEWGGIIEHSAPNGDENLDFQPGIERGILTFRAFLERCQLHLGIDDDFRADSPSSRTKVVVFNDFSRNPKIANLPSKSTMKAFMVSMGEISEATSR